MYKPLIILTISLLPALGMADTTTDAVMAKYRPQIQRAVESGDKVKAEQLGRAVIVETIAIETAKQTATEAAALAARQAQ